MFRITTDFVNNNASQIGISKHDMKGDRPFVVLKGELVVAKSLFRAAGTYYFQSVEKSFHGGFFSCVLCASERILPQGQYFAKEWREKENQLAE